MIPYLLIFLAGVAGSLHCIGMCGGFACALGADSRGPTATLLRHLVYNTGRVTVYCFMGGVIGALGVHIIHIWPESLAGGAQNVLAWIAGGLMILFGLQFLGVFGGRKGQTRNDQTPSAGGTLFSKIFSDVKHSQSPAAPLVLGVINGFLPCPLVYAFAAQAAASGGPLQGALLMAVFGLGTYPAMLIMGGIGAWSSLRFGKPEEPAVRTYPLTRLGGDSGGLVDGNSSTLLKANWRYHGVRLAGVFIVLLGLMTVARGILPMSSHMHGL